MRDSSSGPDSLNEKDQTNSSLIPPLPHVALFPLAR